MLQCHIFDLDLQKLAVLLTECQNIGRRFCVDVDFHDIPGPKSDKALPHRLQTRDQLLHGEGREIDLTPLQLKKQLGAVAEIENAVLIEQGQIERGGLRFVMERGGIRCLIRYLSAQAPEHTIHDADQSRTTGIDHTRFFQYRQHLRCAFERFLRFFDESFQKRVYRRLGVAGHSLGCFAHDGQHRSLRRLDHGAVGVLNPYLHGVGQLLRCSDICFGQLLTQSCKELGQDHS